jgi:hypothetical protein
VSFRPLNLVPLDKAQFFSMAEGSPVEFSSREIGPHMAHGSILKGAVFI